MNGYKEAAEALQEAARAILEADKTLDKVAKMVARIKEEGPNNVIQIAPHMTKKRVLSAKARKAISEAQKKRWREYNREKAKRVVNG